MNGGATKRPSRFRILLDPPCVWINAARRRGDIDLCAGRGVKSSTERSSPTSPRGTCCGQRRPPVNGALIDQLEDAGSEGRYGRISELGTLRSVGYLRLALGDTTKSSYPVYHSQAGHDAAPRDDSGLWTLSTVLFDLDAGYRLRGQPQGRGGSAGDRHGHP